MKPVTKALTSIANSNKTPIVLVVVACSGVIATGIMAAKAAPKAKKIVELAKQEHGVAPCDRLPFGLLLKYTWKPYAPALGVGLITIGTIVSMHRLSERNAALLTAGATLATNTLKEYQQHVLEEIGPERESKVRSKMAQRRLNDGGEYDLVLASGESVCYDSLSGRYFKCDVETVREIENSANKAILTDMYMSLNEFYERLGLEAIDLGDQLGFNIDNLIDIHFSSALTKEKKPVIVIDHINLPVTRYEDNG